MPVEQLVSDNRYYSWIPTNIGSLNFNYIADEYNLEQNFGLDNVQVEIDKTQKNISITKTYLSDINPIIKNRLKI